MIEISKYYIRPLAGNSINTPVHMFVTKHDKRKLSEASKKSYVTAKFNPGRNVLMASSNELLSKYIKMETGCELEIHPITVAKHISEILGMPLVIVDNHFCDLDCKELKWELHFYQPSDTIRHVYGRHMLV